MADAQDIANRIGAALRNTEAAQAGGDLATARAQTATLHAALAEGLDYLSDSLGLNLDMDEITGNSHKTASMHTDGGGAKD